MILGPINGIDCVAFVIFLIPQLLVQVPFNELLAVAVRVIPFLGQQRDLLQWTYSAS
jgi:hypothetical protein